MALIACHECGARISSDTLACPKCGAMKPAVKTWRNVIIVGAVVLFFVLWILSNWAASNP